MRRLQAFSFLSLQKMAQNYYFQLSFFFLVRRTICPYWTSKNFWTLIIQFAVTVTLKPQASQVRAPVTWVSVSCSCCIWSSKFFFWEATWDIRSLRTWTTERHCCVMSKSRTLQPTFLGSKPSSASYEWHDLWQVSQLLNASVFSSVPPGVILVLNKSACLRIKWVNNCKEFGAVPGL